MGLGLALAFYPINGRPFSVYLEGMYHYFTNTKLYLWKQKPISYTNDSSLPAMPTTRRTEQNNLASLSRKLEIETITE